MTGGDDMSRKMILAVFTFLLISSSSLAGQMVCGLNDNSRMSRGEFFRISTQGSGLRTIDYTNKMVPIHRLLVPPTRDFRRSRWRYCMVPGTYMVPNAENAGVWMPPSTDVYSAYMFVDDPWLQSLVEQSGSEWTRTTVLCHEFAHIYLGHVVGDGASTQWQREYDADVLAGTTVRRMGGSLEDARALYYLIAHESDTEDPNSHPSRSYRIKAVSEGWNGSGVTYSTRVQNDYRGEVTIEVDGSRYAIPSGGGVRVSFRDPAATMRLWKCPPSGCVWAEYAIVSGVTTHVVGVGPSTDLATYAE
jgi:hypothetical protein